MGFSIKLLEENLKNSKISPPSLPSFIIVVRELDVDNCHYKTEIVMRLKELTILFSLNCLYIIVDIKSVKYFHLYIPRTDFF